LSKALGPLLGNSMVTPPIPAPLDPRALKDRLDLAKVASRYTRLRCLPRGEWRGLCPLHREQHPSFFVSPSGQGFYCFGCRCGGDLFAFIMAAEHCSFPESLRIAAGFLQASQKATEAPKGPREPGLPGFGRPPIITQKPRARPLPLDADFPSLDCAAERAAIYTSADNCSSALRSSRREGARGRR